MIWQCCGITGQASYLVLHNCLVKLAHVSGSDHWPSKQCSVSVQLSCPALDRGNVADLNTGVQPLPCDVADSLQSLISHMLVAGAVGIVGRCSKS